MDIHLAEPDTFTYHHIAAVLIGAPRPTQATPDTKGPQSTIKKMQRSLQLLGVDSSKIFMLDGEPST